MIYVCEYDGSTGQEQLLAFAVRLPLPKLLGEGGRKEKNRERILAWMLLEYALSEYTRWKQVPSEPACWKQMPSERTFSERTFSEQTPSEHTLSEQACRKLLPSERAIRQDSREADGILVLSEAKLTKWACSQAETFGDRIAALGISRAVHGKPYSTLCPGLQFNLSHCACACACMVGDMVCGIDIERHFSFRESLYRRVCHPKEREVLDVLETEEKEQQFRYLWSLKESFVKLDGRGLGYGMERVELSALLPAEAAELRQLPKRETEAWHTELLPCGLSVGQGGKQHLGWTGLGAYEFLCAKGAHGAYTVAACRGAADGT